MLEQIAGHVDGMNAGERLHALMIERQQALEQFLARPSRQRTAAFRTSLDHVDQTLRARRHDVVRQHPLDVARLELPARD